MQATNQALAARIAQLEEALAREQAAHQHTKEQLSDTSTANEPHPAIHDLLEGVRCTCPRHKTEPSLLLLCDLVCNFYPAWY